jgi:hypothetical protein
VVEDLEMNDASAAALTDHHARPMDGQGQATFHLDANDFFGFGLGLLVGVVETALAAQPFFRYRARHPPPYPDRADEFDFLEPRTSLRQRHDVPGRVDRRAARLFDRQIHAHVAGRVNDVRALAGKLLVIGDGEAEIRQRDIAAQRPQAIVQGRIADARLPEAVERLPAGTQFVGGAGAQEQGALCLRVCQQHGNQGTADRAGGAGDEIMCHGRQKKRRRSTFQASKRAPSAASRCA